MNICIVGAGGVGSFVGARLIQAGCGVSFITSKERRSELGRHGLVVHSPDGAFRSPVRTMGEGDSEIADIVVLANRAHYNSLALIAAGRVIGPDTIVVPLSFDLIRLQSLIEDEIGIPVGAVAELAIAQRLDGSVKHFGDKPRLYVGALDRNSADHSEFLSAVFEDAGFEVAVSSKIRSNVWCRFSFNAIVVAMVRLTNGSFEQSFFSSHGRTIFNDLLGEASRTGAALGVFLDGDQVRWWRNQLHRTSWTRPEPLRVDLTDSARAEADHNLMVMVRHAQDAGVPAPAFERAYYSFRNKEQKSLAVGCATSRRNSWRRPERRQSL